MSSRENYKYLSVNDALSAVNQKVNLIGVVVEFKEPQKSKGTDWFLTLKILDESIQAPGLVVTIFAANMEKLPHVKMAGDIICLCRLMMNSQAGKVNAYFHKRYSSFALFEGNSSNNFVPYQVSSKFYPSVFDKDIITRLRKWFLRFQFNSGVNESLTLLREIKEGECCNLVSKVIHVCGVSRMLFVWDGSDAPPLSSHTRLSDEMENPLPLQLESPPLPRDVLSTFPLVGTILRVDFQQADAAFVLHLPPTGIWVKFVNIVCQVRSGLWYGVFTPSSKLQILSNEDLIVKCRRRIYKKRLSYKWGRIPFSTFPWPSRVTETDYEDMPFVTLMHVLTYREVIGKFKCVVRVVAICPWRVEDFRSPSGSHVYRIKLTIEDPTARIHAFIYAEDGEKFFDGYPPMDVLTVKRNKLLGIAEGDEDKEDDAPRNPPWVQCCVKSYYADKDDPWASRRYRIFGTKLMA